MRYCVLLVRRSGSALIAAAAFFGMGADAPAAVQMLTPGAGEASSGGLSSPSREAPRVFQSFIDNTFLADVTSPVTITGLSFRLPGSAGTAAAPGSYPTVDLNFARYDIVLARPSAAAVAANALVSDTFADNMSNPVVVRSGALTIPAGSLTDADTGVGVSAAGTLPAEFSFVIPFTTPYVLQPGEDLVVFVRNSGYVGTQQVNYNFDTFAYTNGGRVATGDVDAASGSLIPGNVLKYGLVIPEPAGVSVIAAAAAVLWSGRCRKG